MKERKTLYIDRGAIEKFFKEFAEFYNDFNKIVFKDNKMILNFSNIPYEIWLADIETKADIIKTIYRLANRPWINTKRLFLVIRLLADAKGLMRNV